MASNLRGGGRSVPGESWGFLGQGQPGSLNTLNPHDLSVVDHELDGAIAQAV